MNYTLKRKTHSTLLTVPEAAKKLRVSNWMIYQLIRNKELKTFTIGTKRLIDSDDLADYIKNRKEINL